MSVSFRQTLPNTACNVEDSASAPLVDTFGRIHTYLRVSLTDRCNLRCVYCMPPEGVPLSPKESLLNFDEIVRIVRLMVGMGVSKVRLTGGEPLVRHDVPALVARLGAIPGIRELAMTTNGVLLGSLAKPLREAGLTTVNVSLDTLQPGRFAKLTRRYEFDRVLAGIDAALGCGFDPVKLNVVLMRGFNDDEIEAFVDLARTGRIEIRFIEFMPFPGNGWSLRQMVPYDEILVRLRTIGEVAPVPDQDPAAPARLFTVRGVPGRIGIIASMTQAFCATCTRLRLGVDGALKTCLFHPPTCSLRDVMRSGADDADLCRRIREALHGKPMGHPAVGTLEHARNHSMVQIGG